MYGTPKWYLALRGYYYFIDNYNRAPGSIDAELEQDALILKVYKINLLWLWFILIIVLEILRWNM